MTTISDAYDLFVTQIETSLPSHVELINPYIVEANDDLTFSAAFGLGILEGINSERELGCNYTVRRSFSVVLTRKMFKGDQARGTAAVAERRAAEKQLFEDLHLLIKDVSGSPTLNSSGGGDIAWCKYVSDSGLEFIAQDRVNLVMLRAIFEIEYFEHI